MQSGKSYAAAASAASRKPQTAGAKASGSASGSNGAAAATNKKNSANRAGETKSNSKSNGKDVPAPATSPTAAAPPGFAGGSTKQPTRSGFSAAQQRVLRHRALFAFRFFVGKAVSVQLDDASIYSGVLDCIDPDDFSIVLKNTQRTSAYGEAFESGSTVIFKRRQIAHLTADGVVNYADIAASSAAAATASSGFRTDTEISGRQLEHLVGRELETAASWLDPQLDSGELEDPKQQRRSSKTNWNQFEANEKLFGVVSGFDETLYTTKLDKSKLSSQQSRDAERIALEIERQTTNNFHLQEERNHHHSDNRRRSSNSSAAQLKHDDLDEEARYSSVDRRSSKTALTPGKSSYVPPALRNASQQRQQQQSQQQSQSAAKDKQTAKATAKPFSFSDAVTGRTTKAETTTAVGAKTETTTTTTDVKKQLVVATADADASDVKEPVQTPPNDKKDAKAKLTSPIHKTTKTTTHQPPAAAVEPKAPAAAKKLTTPLNPNAKEFKLNVAAAAFTPKFALSTPSPSSAVPSSPYRSSSNAQQQLQSHGHQNQQQYQQQGGGGHYQQGGHYSHYPQQSHYQHHQQHPMGHYQPPMYAHMPSDEWLYDAHGNVIGPLDDTEQLMAMQQPTGGGGYLPYGVVPIGGVAPPPPGTTGGVLPPPQLYSPQLLPQRMPPGSGSNSSSNSQRPHGGHGGYNSYQQQSYNPRGYYPPSTAGGPGTMPYAAPGSGVVQPPLPPREPSPSAEVEDVPPRTSSTPASPALPPQQQQQQQPPTHGAKASAKK